jgi:hypothetical protein
MHIMHNLNSSFLAQLTIEEYLMEIPNQRDLQG